MPAPRNATRRPSSVTPAPSDPPVRGSGPAAATVPRETHTSSGLTAARVMSMTTSPGPGTGSGTFWRTSGSPYASCRMARTPLDPDAADADVLDRQVLVDADRAALAAVARLLDAAERRVRGRDDAGVGADDAVVELLGDPQQAGIVAGVEVRGEAVDGVVRVLDRLRLVVERRQARDGAERLLAVDQHLVGDAGQHGRLVERAALVLPAREPLAAGDEGGAVVQRVFDVLLGLLDRAVVDQRADGDAVRETVADGELRDLLGQALRELVVDAALDVHAVRADAGLARVAELRGDQAVDGLVQVGVVEDHVRRVAAELERQLLDAVGGEPDQLLADLRRAGERDLADARVAEQLARDHARRARRDEVDDALRHAGVLDAAQDRGRRQRRRGGGLDD